jgi:hypothetical protein
MLVIPYHLLWCANIDLFVPIIRFTPFNPLHVFNFTISEMFQLTARGIALGRHTIFRDVL